jgi:predicted kinase
MPSALGGNTAAVPLLVVVTGPPASGKSTLARQLASSLGVPFLSKDELKERLYEVFGDATEAEDEVERAALAILFSVTRSNLEAGVDVLVESNFDATTDTALFDRLDARVVQVHCGGDPAELAEEFAKRAASGRRHPGHDDDPEDAAEVRKKIEAGFWDPLPGVGEVVEVDATTDTRGLARRLRDRSRS